MAVEHLDDRCPDCGGELLRGPCTAPNPIPHGNRLNEPARSLATLGRVAPALVRLLPLVYARRVVRHAEQGGTVDQDDDERDPHDWCMEIRVRLTQADTAAMGLDRAIYRERLLRVAELALAAIASYERTS